MTKEEIDLDTELVFNNTAEDGKAGAFKIKKFSPICGHPAYKTDLEHIYLYFPDGQFDYLALQPSSVSNVKIASGFGSGLNLLDSTTTTMFNKLVHEIRFAECQQNVRALKVIDICITKRCDIFMTSRHELMSESFTLPKKRVKKSLQNCKVVVQYGTSQDVFGDYYNFHNTMTKYSVFLSKNFHPFVLQSCSVAIVHISSIILVIQFSDWSSHHD